MLLNKKGVSLVEVMIALVILLLVFLALMQTALVSIDANIRNLLRDEAVSIAEQRMTALKNRLFTVAVTDAVLNDTGGVEAADNVRVAAPMNVIPRSFRNFSVDFFLWKNIDDLNTENKQITIIVRWTWKGEAYSHAISTVMRMQ